MLVRGIVIGTSDPKNVGRYLVHIPTLMAGGDYTKDGIWCENGLNNVIRFKSTQGDEVQSMGNYTPLKTGMGVEVEMITKSHGKIVRVVDNSNTPSPNKANRDGFHQLISTVDNTYIYYDEKEKLFHILVNNGEANLIFNENTFYLNVGHTEEAEPKGSKGVQKKTGTVVKVVDKGLTIHQNESFIKLFDDDLELRTSKKSYIHMNKDVLELYAPNVIVNADNKLHLHSDNEVVISAKETIVDKTSKRRTETTELEVKTKTISTDSDGTTLKMGKSGVELDTAGFISKAKANQFVGSISVNGSVSSQSVYGITGVFGSVSSPSPLMAQNSSAPSIALGVKTTIGNTARTAVTGGTAGISKPESVDYGTFLGRKFLSENEMPYDDVDYISEAVIRVRKHDETSNKEVVNQVESLKRGKLW